MNCALEPSMIRIVCILLINKALWRLICHVKFEFIKFLWKAKPFSCGIYGVYTVITMYSLFYSRVPPVATCRQCPAYTGLLSPLCRGTTVSYTCPTPASHVMCQCCLQFMPIRPPPSDTPPQKCALCDKFYCNQYWQSGCRGMACNCLRLFKG